MCRFAALLLLVLAAGGAVAGDVKEPAQTIAPFVDDQTFLVVRIDVARLKPDEVVRRLEQFLGSNVAADKKDLPELHAKFVRAGGKELFLLFNMAEGMSSGLVVVPLGADANKDALRALLKEPANNHVEEKAGALLVGLEKAVAAAMNRPTKAMPELAKAFAAVEAATAQIVVLPPRTFLRAQEELNPNLPKELGGGPITTITRGLQWAAVGVDINPGMQIKAVAQATDKEAAEELNKLTVRAINGVVAAVERGPLPLAPLLPMLKPKVEGSQLVLTLDDKAITAVLTPAVNQTRLAAMRAQSVNNLKQMGLAMHNYHDVYKSFPPGGTVDQNNKPPLSWRVHILPFIEGDALYKQFKLDEPWDSEHNKKLIPKMPTIYKSPLAKNVAAGKTVYLAPAGEGMIFAGPKGMPIQKIADGTSNTIMLVEANDDHAVIWTKPDDYKPDRKDPLAPLLRKELKGFHAALADGSVRTISSTINADTFWAYLTVAGGEVIQEK